MEKIALNHDGKNIPDAIGMPEERSHEIIRAIQHAEIESRNTVELMENAFNAVQPNNLVEAMFLGYTVRGIQEQAIQSPIQALMQALGKS